MIKKIRADRLKPGMFIHDLNCGWLEHPFMKNSFLIRDEAAIHKILGQNIREVFIDTEKGIDDADAVEAALAGRAVETRLRDAAEKAAPAEDPVSMEKELKNAKKVKMQAMEVATSVLGDVRMGKQVNVEKVEKVVTGMVDSIFNNRHALTTLSRLKSKDQYTFMHSVNVCVLMLAFARTLNADRETMGLIGIGSLLHDVGKMTIPDTILNKYGKLTDEEFALMKSHPREGRRILEETGGIAEVSIEVVYQHHERYDGSGYPEGLKGSDISLPGQMAAIVDVYDAITSDRCYHVGMDAAAALRKMSEWGGFHFDGRLMESFLHTVGIYPVGTLVRLESGLMGVVTKVNPSNLTRPKVKLVYSLRKNLSIRPRDLDLARQDERDADRIAGVEDPRNWWFIEPLKYLDIE